ncbi:MAG TPA: ABC transporter ATP-binding protein [Bdellovibrionota bacterium]|nr:ABC transporter ATP-binding protein [Bdellovibrionota bacterium]
MKQTNFNLPAVETIDLTHSYGTRIALNGVSLSVSRGESFGFLGPNGGGKTTLFRILSTLISPTSGTARIFGRDVAKEPNLARKEIGVVFQNPSLDARLTVRENLAHQGHLYGMHGRSLRQRADDLLNRFGLIDRANDTASSLSGGLKRRVEIAKALLHTPRLLLLDEPSTGLDPAARREVWKMLEQLRKEGDVTVLLTTHIMEEADGCDRIAILHHGRVVSVGTPDELKRKVRGDVISLDAGNAAQLAGRIAKRFSVEPTVIDGCVRIEHPQATQFLVDVVNEFRTDISAVTLRKPTLEDVFVHETGDRFWESLAENRA